MREVAFVVVVDGDARHVVLVGAMGSGKTTIGGRLAAALDRKFLDNDVALRQRTGCTAAQLEARDGIDALHDAEAAALLSSLGDSAPAVIGAAASTIVDPEVQRALRGGVFVVWLRPDRATLTARMPRSSTRPFAGEDPVQLVARQSRERDPLFAQVADLTLDSADGTPERAVTRIIASFPGSRRANG